MQNSAISYNLVKHYIAYWQNICLYFARSWSLGRGP